MTAFAQAYPITDICFLVQDIERSIAFYAGRLGFIPRRRAEGFADFSGAGITLALWEIGHMADHIGLADRTASGSHKACAAVELPTAAAVDAAYVDLSSAGVVFNGSPANYIWNARCCYFADPDGNLWEIYAWLEGGPVGDLNKAD